MLIVGVPLPPAKYATLDQRNRFAEELLERVGGLPGVEAATIGLPFGGPQSPFTIVGQPADESKRITINLAGADHLRTFGIALRGGRMFDASDVRRGDRVAVVNEAAAKLWPAGENPIGSRLRLGVLERPPARTLADTSRVARGDHHRRRRKHAECRAARRSAPGRRHAVLDHRASSSATLAVRTAGDPNLLLNPVRAQVRAIDVDQPLGRPITLSEVLGQDVIQPRFTMALFSAFAALGLALAAAGIYSVLSFHVTRRTHELGVRMALGAPRGHVLGLMLTMGGRLVLVGLAIGFAASLASTRLLRSQLFGVESADPIAYAAVAVLLGLVAIVACYIPARRAAGVTRWWRFGKTDGDGERSEPPLPRRA